MHRNKDIAAQIDKMLSGKDAGVTVVTVLQETGTAVHQRCDIDDTIQRSR